MTKNEQQLLRKAIRLLDHQYDDAQRILHRLAGWRYVVDTISKTTVTTEEVARGPEREFRGPTPEDPKRQGG